jgi:hypothetical protein
MTLNTNIFPKTGFMFVEKDGARIFGQTWAGVFARVAAYRRRKGQPEGDVPGEVIAQACSREPIICNHGTNAPLNQQAVPLKTRVLAWLNSLRANREKHPVEIVSWETARERTEICAKCPKNQGLADGCASCRAALRELRDDLVGNRFKDGRLNECDVLGEDLPVSVYLEQQTVEHGGLPANCWRRRSL